MSRRSAIVTFLLLTVGPVLVHAQWPTHRGDPARTGAADDQPGPTHPAVLWVHKSHEHFVAPPVVAGQMLLLPALGAFNTSSLHAFHLEPRPGKQAAWSRTAPYLKLPVVCSPAVADGLIVFGDGMHQTDGAVLHCLQAGSGLPLWQLPVPGKLVHLEGAPTIDRGKVFMGGGNAGVLCVDARRVTLDGQELELAAIPPIIEEKWRALVAKYDADKRKDPDFAVPPSEDQLPKPSPKLLWSAGKDAWHVDAPIAIAGERVLAASAFLEAEKCGQRALLCLDAGDGKELWRAQLRLNPWAGPTLAGDVVLVGCSSIRFDPKAIARARGEIVALDLATGRERWRRETAGGITSAIATRDGVAYACTTAGQVLAYEVASGKRLWSHDAGAGFFAGPAVAANAVYAADLKGNVHALDRAKGDKLWTLSLANDPAVNAPGMAYGGPALYRGRLYVATCNLEGDHARRPTVVVCIGNK